MERYDYINGHFVFSVSVFLFPLLVILLFCLVVWLKEIQSFGKRNLLLVCALNEHR